MLADVCIACVCLHSDYAIVKDLIRCIEESGQEPPLDLHKYWHQKAVHKRGGKNKLKPVSDDHDTEVCREIFQMPPCHVLHFTRFFFVLSYTSSLGCIPS